MIELPLVSLDLELLDAENGAEIIEVGAVKFRGRETLGTFSTLVRPVGTLSFRIADLTGLTGSQLQQAEELSEVLPRLSTFVGSAPLVGQSIGIDVEHLKRAGLTLKNPRLDTFELATLMRPGLPAYDLAAIARELGIKVTNAHRALSDALVARDVLLALASRADELGLDLLSQVVRLAGPLDWPLKLVFAEAQRTKVRAMIERGDPVRAGAGQDLSAGLSPPADIPALVPRERREPLDVQALTRALGPGGSVASHMPEFEDRPEQREMLAAVAEAFNEGGVLLVEAGTGTGKSLAYLLPALQFALLNDEQVVVSTNTINLQDQLRAHDIPFLLRATGLSADVAVLKGRANYLCLRRWQSLLASDNPSPAERMLLIKTLLWVPTTSTGDRTELRLTNGEEEAWGKLAAIQESCNPRRCTFHREGVCFVARARHAAETAHLVVVNHSLLLADMVAGNQVLPEHRYLVIDEAHHLEDEATSQLGRRVTEREIARRLDELATTTSGETVGLLAEAANHVRARCGTPARDSALHVAARAEREVQNVRVHIQHVFSLLRPFIDGQALRGEGGRPSVRVTSGMRAQPAWSDVDIAWGEAARAFLGLQRTTAELISLLEEVEFGDVADEAFAAVGGELAAQGQFWDETRRHLIEVIGAPCPETIAWLSMGTSEELAVNSAPLHVGPIIRDRLMDTKESAVLTSATLTSEGSFRYIRERLGLVDAHELIVGSPFDYRASTLVYVPADGLEPGTSGYQRSVEATVFDVATELGGRTLVLFTSNSQLRVTYQALRDSLDTRHVVVLGQRMDGSSRMRLLEAFKSGKRCVLMGTNSFWEGVDVVGDALSCVIITRLPFAAPTDPIVAARAEQFDDPFSEYTLPQAILRLRQGFGRLIRSRTDRGVMLVLDGRLRTRGYGRAFLRSLPACNVRSGPLSEAGRASAEWVGLVPTKRGERAQGTAIR